MVEEVLGKHYSVGLQTQGINIHGTSMTTDEYHFNALGQFETEAMSISIRNGRQEEKDSRWYPRAWLKPKC